MKQQLLVTSFSFILFFLLLFIYIKVAGPIPFAVDSVTTNKSDSFSVTGEGAISVKPDVAIINAGIQTEAPTVQAAQEKINSVINTVSTNTKKLGISDTDIQTTNYNVQPKYDYSQGAQKITGYQANTNLNIKVRDISKINSVIDTATTSGANQIGNVSFEINDKTQAENQARVKAVAEAKRKAEQAAQMAGFRLGKLINYSENFEGAPRPIPMASKALDNTGSGTPTSVEPGSSEIKISVTLSYEVRAQ